MFHGDGEHSFYLRDLLRFLLLLLLLFTLFSDRPDITALVDWA